MPEEKQNYTDLSLSASGGGQGTMFSNYNFTAAERFMRYVQIDTQSNPLSATHPTSERQKDLSRILVEELKAMGIQDAEMDDWGYVYATVPSNTDKDVPVICF